MTLRVDPSPSLDTKSLHDLEWSTLLERIAQHCLGAPATAAVLSMVPGTSLEEARLRTARTAEALAAAEQGVTIPAEAIEEVAEVLERAQRGAAASGRELFDLKQVLRVARQLRSFAAAQGEARPALAACLTSPAELDVLAKRLEDALESDGTLSDGASPELRQVRRRVNEARRELSQRLGELVTRYSEVLRERYYTERDGRFVLPVRADAHLRVSGIVLGASASGGTLYVEPQEITGLGNRLTLLLGEVEREETRVLAELTELVAVHLDAVKRAREVCINADVLAALVRWAFEAGAHSVFPEDEPLLLLQSMRHPLLVGSGIEVVPSDLELAAGQALIVSGPNAGGKTVALKCLGLAALMVASGIPVPAQPGSRVGWFDAVLTDVGDEQSLARSLSTFSAHVDNLARILSRADRHVLVLLDELAGGTDPEEGSALAVAVLEALVEQGAAVAVTTHYERLKEIAAEESRFVNASVGFDLKQMAPTFRVTLGVPGPSSALAVAARFGIAPSVVARAQALVPKRSLDRDQLLRELETEREALRVARRLAEVEATRQGELRAELERERNRIREQERTRLVREGEQLMVGVREARNRLRTVERTLAESGLTPERLRELGKEVDRAAHQVAIGSELGALMAPASPATRLPREDELVVGAVVYLAKLGRTAEILELPTRGQVRVMAGSLKLLVRVEELELAQGQKRKDARPARRPTAPAQNREMQAVNGFVPTRTKSNTLDLRGERVEEAISLIDAFMDRLLSAGEPVGYVLHGHGTGRLRQKIREHLGTSRYAARSGPAAPDDGGDAFTQIWLRG